MPPVELAPDVDSRMVAPPAVSCAIAQPPPRRKGKGKAKAGTAGEYLGAMIQEAGDAMPEGICRKEGVFTLLCFCCPMPPLKTYCKLYVPSEDPCRVLSSLGKSIINLHAKFGARKAAGKAAIHEAQSTHSKIFHQDEELSAVIAQCLSYVSDTPYGPAAEEVLSWLANMTLEEQISGVPTVGNMVDDADQASKDWNVVKSGPLVLHTIMQGGPVNLGWSTSNCFATIAEDVPSVIVPSEVTDNA
jgi:hypothetical protein